MATDYGFDTYCLDDTQYIDTVVTDPRIVVGQRIARRLQVPRGALGLINDDPNGGFDVRQYVNAALSPNELKIAQSTIQAECLKDEEVESVIVTMSLVAGSLTIDISMVGAAGPFVLTLAVSDLTTQAVFSFGNQQANP